MTDESSADSVRVELRARMRWNRTPVAALGAMSSVLIVIAGLLFSRADIVLCAAPLVLVTVRAFFAPQPSSEGRVVLSAHSDEGGAIRGEIRAENFADWTQLAIDQGGVRKALADTAATVTTKSKLSHSGPHELVATIARGVAADGVWVSDPLPRVALDWHVSPRLHPMRELSRAPKLTGLHGTHQRHRPGSGGDFHDLHPFAPGDEIRRVDWRATARAARQDGELLVRRTTSLSESNVVIAIDARDDLGEVVASWGKDDPERSGITSLDLAREAALSIALAAVQAHDRVALHVLSPGGRTVRSGTGARHLARLKSVIATIGKDALGLEHRRVPRVESGSLIYLLSPFLDPRMAEVSIRWRAEGHRVVVVDVLPELDTARLTAEQLLASRVLMAERDSVMRQMEHEDIATVRWHGSERDTTLLIAARQERQRGRR